ncbi:MAG: ATP-binding cassette domain-containing protein, partial [Clostridiales bacterium]|nr:ATP-binding cassette domain-containing protein [Clostridiales bacterium]
MLIFEKVSFNYGAGQPKKRRGKKTGAAPPEQQGRERRQGQEHEREHGREPGRKQGQEQWQGPEPSRERGQEHEQGHEQEREFGRKQGQEPEPKRERRQEQEHEHERLLGATISDVTFRLNEGEFAALMGENGAGKSTLCRLCNGLLLPDSGSVTACGRDTRTARTSDIAAGVGFLFQNPDRQLCQNTVRDEIMFGLDLTMPGSAEPER